jgi:hypothetical protein
MSPCVRISFAVAAVAIVAVAFYVGDVPVEVRRVVPHARVMRPANLTPEATPPPPPPVAASAVLPVEREDRLWVTGVVRKLHAALHAAAPEMCTVGPEVGIPRTVVFCEYDAADKVELDPRGDMPPHLPFDRGLFLINPTLEVRCGARTGTPRLTPVAVPRRRFQVCSRR